MTRWNRFVLLLLISSLIPMTAVQAGSTPRGTALLGTIQTISLEITPPAATQAQLYETWSNVGPKPVSSAAPLRVRIPDRIGPLDPQLLEKFSLDTTTDMLVYLREQVDLQPALQIRDWNERGAFVVELLQNHAKTSQSGLQNYLIAHTIPYESFWIVNAIKVHGDRQLAESLAQRSDVGLVTLDTRYVQDTVTQVNEIVPQSIVNSVPWGLEKVQAPRTWDEWGVRGQGIVVANIDTGVMFDHETLLHSYRGWTPNGISHDYHWFDPTTTPSETPIDADGHGTHTMGTIVGGGIGDIRAIGVAPAARWIAARGCASRFCSESALIASAQWMLAPTRVDGSAPRPDLRPHIINNSWAGDGENPWYRDYVVAWNASGIISIFANGNKGAVGCGSGEAPGVYDISFSVGATGANDEIANFSSRGRTSDGRIKPDMTAPGVGVASAALNGSLRDSSGTSMAAPHVAGVAALLLSANPLLIGDIQTTHNFLKNTSTPLYSELCGDAPNTVPNAVFGAGRLEAYQAVQEVRVDVPWLQVPEVVMVNQPTTTIPVTLDARQVSAPGMYYAQVMLRYDTGTIEHVPLEFEVLPNPAAVSLQGRLVDKRTHTGIIGRVQLDQGPAIVSAPNGSYNASVLPGTYTVLASSIGYIDHTESFEIAEAQTKEFRMIRDAPHLVLESRTISVNLAYGGQFSTEMLVSNIGPRALSVTATIPPDEWSIERGTTSGQLYDLSTIQPLLLDDDQVYPEPFSLNFSVPIFGTLVDEIYVSSNGWISANYRSGAQPSARCLPDTSLPKLSLAPFWTDLNPEAGGSIRAGHVDPTTFVVSYEDVPFWTREPAPTDPTYTFQVALHADGSIEYVYGAMDRLPLRWSIGAGFDKLRGQSFACYPNKPSLSNQRWSIFNQAPANLWLSTKTESLLLEPGAFQRLTLDVRGVGYRSWRPEPMQGTLKLYSNDPLTPLIDVPATLQVGAPQVYFWLPTLR